MSKLKLENRLIDMLPVAIYTCAPDGRITGYNNKAAEIWGRHPKLGDTDQRFCGAFRLYRPNGEFMAHAATPMAECLAKQEPQVNRAAIIERPDGSRIQVLVNIQPLFDELHQFIGAVNVFHEIADLKLAEQEATAAAS